MDTRYSRLRSDDTIARHDTEADIDVDALAEPGPLECSACWALIGFIGGLLVALVAVAGDELGSWLPKWARFLFVLGFASLGAWIMARVGALLFTLFLLALMLSFLSAIVVLVWVIV